MRLSSGTIFSTTSRAYFANHFLNTNPLITITESLWYTHSAYVFSTTISYVKSYRVYINLANKVITRPSASILDVPPLRIPRVLDCGFRSTRSEPIFKLKEELPRRRGVSECWFCLLVLFVRYRISMSIVILLLWVSGQTLAGH